MYLEFIKTAKGSLVYILTFICVFSGSHMSFASGDKINYPQKEWSFSGIVGTFDRASQQRGLQV